MQPAKRPITSHGESSERDATSADPAHIRDNEAVDGRAKISSGPDAQEEMQSPQIRSPPRKESKKGEEDRHNAENILAQVVALPQESLNFDLQSQGGGSSQSISSSRLSGKDRIRYLQAKRRANEKQIVAARLEAENELIEIEII
jgi:hypothetical protein